MKFNNRVFPIIVESFPFPAGTIVNPQRQPPIPAELGFALPLPGAPLPVVFDHCRESNGDMIEAKGHYEDVLKFRVGRENLAEEFKDQALRQIQAADANGGRRIEWHFYEEQTMEFAREVFAEAKFFGRIRLVHTDYPGDEKWPYPEGARRTWARGRQRQ